MKIFHSKLSKSRYEPLKDLILMEQKRADMDRESFETIWNLLSAQFKDIIGSEPENLAHVIMTNSCLFFERMFAEQVVEATHYMTDQSMLSRVKIYTQKIIEPFSAGTTTI